MTGDGIAKEGVVKGVGKEYPVALGIAGAHEVVLVLLGELQPVGFLVGIGGGVAADFYLHGVGEDVNGFAGIDNLYLRCPVAGLAFVLDAVDPFRHLRDVADAGNGDIDGRDVGKLLALLYLCLDIVGNVGRG